MKFWFRQNLLIQIAVATILGVAAGLLLGDKAAYLQPVGDIFLALLGLLIVPLVISTLLSGITQMGSVNDLGRIGFRFFFYLTTTSLLAAAVGVGMGLLVRPGIGVDLSAIPAAKDTGTQQYSFVDTLLSWVPSNVFEAMAEANMVQIIVATILFGVAILLLGKERVPSIFTVIDEVAQVVLKVTSMIIALSPYGIFALIAVLVGTTGTETLTAAAKFVAADYAAIVLIALVVYPIILGVFARVNPLTFYRNALPASLFAMGTASSSGTIPVSTRVAADNIGVGRSVYGFTVPFGATANMDGFAAALGIIAVLAADIYGHQLTVGFILQIVLLGLVLSVGAAGVRGAGIVMSTVLLQSLGMPLTLIPLLAAVWPIIDVAHTGLNVTGDLVGTTVVGARSGELDRATFAAPNAGTRGEPTTETRGEPEGQPALAHPRSAPR